MKAFIKIVLFVIAISAIFAVETSPEPKTDAEKEAMNWFKKNNL